MNLRFETGSAAAAGYFKASFKALGGPCELLFDVSNEAVAERALRVSLGEVTRIEHKLSRYRDDGIVAEINRSQGKPVRVDPEVAALLDFCEHLWSWSDGAFDITSGVFRRAWTFDGGDRVPTAGTVEALRRSVGWSRVRWQSSTLQLEPGMEIDLGGVGKEYAVDRVAALLQELDLSALVNLGGDVATTRGRRDGSSWQVGIEGTLHDPALSNGLPCIALDAGAVATSGDSHRYVLKDGVRYGHVLDARTGWPPERALHWVTVQASTCTEAGALATLAMLKGTEAEAFLEAAGHTYWCGK